MRPVSPPALRAVFFDLDGTLVDSLPGIAFALASAFASIGKQMPPLDLRRIIGPPIREIASRVDPTLKTAETEQIERHYRPLYDTLGWQQTTLFPGVFDTIQTLHGLGLELFVVTNKPTIPSHAILHHIGLAGKFQQIVTRDSVTPHFISKVAMLRSLLEHLDPANCLMVGDTAEDAEAAELSHMPFAFMSYGYGTYSGPAPHLSHFSDLLTLDLIARQRNIHKEHPVEIQ